MRGEAVPGAPAPARAALSADPGLGLWANTSVTEQFRDFGARVHTVDHGDTFTAAGFGVHVYGRKHAVALLAASPLAAVRDPQLARSAANTLIHAGEIHSDPQMFEVVAAAYAASHEYGNAVDAEREAIQKALALGWNTGAMQQRLAAYRHDAPWLGDLYAAVPAGR